ncbi:DNA-directed RNA polymerase subunit alpha [Trichinella pseudospiralis]
MRNEYFSLVPLKSNIDGMQWEGRLDGEEPKRPRLLFVGASSSRPPLAAATGVALFSHPAAASLKTSAAEASCQELALNNA